jgi:murein DD-endopeptidase MepM/ murein hydrolase activator NlpD
VDYSLLAFNRFVVIAMLAILTVGTSCENDDNNCQSGQNIDCGNVNWRKSSYILPYPKGNSYRVNQGNNDTCGGHQNAYKYGYDFDMPVGAIVTASRNGIVSEVRNNNPDGENLVLGNENLVKILHEDGTTMAYSHLKKNSVIVTVRQVILQGDTLGLSGNSGYTGNFPHLHFHLSNCDEPTNAGCSTLLIKFKNTRANDCGLIQNEYYEAL